MLTPDFLDSTGVIITVPADVHAELIADATASGDVTEAIEYWRNRLGFTVPEDRARAYLTAAGVEDVEQMDADTLAAYVLWLAAPEGIEPDTIEEATA